jgi:peroxiredoxin
MSFKKLGLYLVIALAIGVFYYWRYRTVPEIDFSKVKLKDKNGQLVALNEVMADSTVIHFYATWCGPCMKELRELNVHFSQYKNTGIKFIFITDDQIDQINVIKEKMPAQISIYQAENMQDLGIYSIPASYFVRSGSIKQKQVDQVNWSDLNTIKKYFN